MCVRVQQIYIDPNRERSMHSTAGREKVWPRHATKVNALKPRVLVSKVRTSISDPERSPRSLRPQHQSSLQGASLPPLTRSPKPTAQVKAFLWENNGVGQLDRICSSFLWSERVLREHQCSNAAAFPVYKPPATLPGMVSGLRTKMGGKKHPARWTTKLSD